MPAPEWRIVFYQDRRGNSDVLDFITALPAGERAKVDFMLQLLKIYGLALKMPHVRQIEGKLWELRPGGLRLLYFTYVNRQFVVLHAFRKQTNRTPKREIELALRRMQEFVDREEE